MVSENAAQTARALIDFPSKDLSTSTVPFFSRYKYAIGRHVLISPDKAVSRGSMTSAPNRQVENLESSFRIQIKALRAILGHFKWSATNSTTECKITVRHVEATNRVTGASAVRAKSGGDGSGGGREVNMRVDLLMSSGIQKSYQLGCLSGMGSAAQVREMKRLYLGKSSSSGGSGMSTAISASVSLVRSVVAEMIDPRSEDFVVIVRESSVVLKGVTEGIHDAFVGDLVNMPRVTTVKIPLEQLVRCAAIKGTLIQMPLRPVRTAVDLAAAVFLTPNKAPLVNPAAMSGSGTFESELSSGPGNDDLALSTLDIFMNEQGNFTHFQPYYSGSNGGGGGPGFWFVFEVACKSHREDSAATGARSSRKRARSQLSRVSEEGGDSFVEGGGDSEPVRINHNRLARSGDTTLDPITVETGMDENDGDGDDVGASSLFVSTQGLADDDIDNPNRSFGRLLSRSTSTTTSKAGGGPVGSGAAVVDQEYGLSQLGNRDQFTSNRVAASGGRPGDYLKARYSKSARVMLGVDGTGVPGDSVGWDTGDVGYGEDEEEEEVQELRQSQFKRRLVTENEEEEEDVGGRNEIGPTQQDTVIKGLFD